MHAAVLRDGEVLPVPFARNRLPDSARVFGLPALNCVDDHAALGRHCGRLGRRRLLLVVFVRRRIADEEENLRGVLQLGRVLCPTGLRDTFGQGAAHVFGRVAAAVRVIVHQSRIDLVQVARERQHFRDVLVADITISDEADAHVRVRGRLHHFVDDAPDALLRALDQTAHRAGRVNHKDHFERVVVCVGDRCRVGCEWFVRHGGARVDEHGGGDADADEKS